MNPKQMTLWVGISLFVALASLSCCHKKMTKIPPPSAAMEQPAAPLVAPPVALDTTDTSSFTSAKLEGAVDSEARAALQAIHFDFDKSNIRPVDEARLTTISKFMANHYTLRFLVAGNCDERGSSEYNMGLGQRRAQAAKDFLTNLGVATNRVETTSYGKERLLIAGCTDEACHAKNRRDEFSVMQGQISPVSSR
jgi:peptidoglycan-associated lipoprotein